MAADLKRGDRVRVTIEGEVTNAFRAGDVGFEIRCAVRSGDRKLLFSDPVVRGNALSYEKIESPIEPPVETFGPGDTVRDRINTSCVYSIGKDGHFSHTTLHYYRGGDSFTSARYERIELG